MEHEETERWHRMYYVRTSQVSTGENLTIKTTRREKNNLNKITKK